MGRGTWTVDSNAFFTFDTGTTETYFNAFNTAYLAGTPVTVCFAHSTPATNFGSNTGVPVISPTIKKFSGSAYVTKFDISSKDQDVVTYSVSFEGDGAYTFA
jgi:hypothetical protein